MSKIIDIISLTKPDAECRACVWRWLTIGEPLLTGLGVSLSERVRPLQQEAILKFGFRARTPDQMWPTRLFLFMWLAGACLVALLSWLGPELANLESERVSANQTNYYLSISFWFVAFGVAYAIVSVLGLSFGRIPSLVHFVLMATGSALILSPPFLLAAAKSLNGGPDTISLETVSSVVMWGYGLTTLSLIVFIAALGLCIVRAVQKARP